jgi:hypothetical protein
MLDKAHIDTLVTAAVAWGVRWTSHNRQKRGTVSPENANQLGELLCLTNWEGVRADWGRDDAPKPPAGYRWTKVNGTVHALTVLRAIQAFEYQSDGGAGYHESDARQIIEALRRIAVKNLPGFYNAEGASITDHRVFERAMGMGGGPRRTKPEVWTLEAIWDRNTPSAVIEELDFDMPHGSTEEQACARGSQLAAVEFTPGFEVGAVYRRTIH